MVSVVSIVELTSSLVVDMVVVVVVVVVVVLVVGGKLFPAARPTSYP